MTIREQNIERFDAYVKGKLIGDDKALFEQELLEKEDLNADFKAYKAEVMLIKTLGIRDEMGQVMTSKSVTKKTGQRRWLIPLGVAAALVLVVLFIRREQADSNAMFEEYFRPYPNAVTSRADKSDIGKALSAYEEGEYNQAISLLTGMKQSDTVVYYSAVSHLALKNAKVALQEFNSIETESLFSEPSIWYKGLSFLLMEEKDSVSFYLKQIDVDNPNYKSAQEILKTILQ